MLTFFIILCWSHKKRPDFLSSWMRNHLPHFSSMQHAILTRMYVSSLSEAGNLLPRIPKYHPKYRTFNVLGHPFLIWMVYLRAGLDQGPSSRNSGPQKPQFWIQETQYCTQAVYLIRIRPKKKNHVLNRELKPRGKIGFTKLMLSFWAFGTHA